MTYLGDGEQNAVLARQEAQLRIAVGTMTVRVLASGLMTGGRYSLYQLDLAPEGGGAAPHFHREFAESFQVLSGVVRLYDGGEWVDAGPGDHLVVPEGGIHGFRNERPEPVSMLMASTPAAPREAYFAELAELAAAGAQLSPPEWTELYARHDQYMV
jgi:mannose-6-phosphate isomerase-like protein (cupin superfamily)